MFNIIMKKQALRAITHFCAKDDIRYYLNGALVEVSNNGRACLVGTNGHSLGMIDLGETIPGAVAGQYILPRSAFEKMPKPRRNDFSWLKLTIDGDSFTLGELAGEDDEASPCNSSVSGKLIDGKFPDWRRVIPDQVSGEAAQYNPVYLLAAQKAAVELGGSQYGHLGQNGERAAALITFEGADMLAVVMPWRVDESNGTAAELMGRFTCKIWADAEFCPVPPAMQRAADEYVQGAPDDLADAAVEKVMAMSADEIRALPFAEFMRLYDTLEDINAHTENVLLEAKRYGGNAEIAEAEAIYNGHVEAGSLTPDLARRRNALCETIWAARHVEQDRMAA